MSEQHIEPTSRIGATFQVEPKPGSSKLVIFFSATGAKPSNFNFWKEGSKLPCHRIFINNGLNEWYQNGVPGLGSSVEETVATLKKWAASLGAREIYTCGASMGAYAALLYGLMLDARILSFAGETILGIEGSRSVSHIQKGTVLRYPDLSQMIAGSSKPIFHYAGEMDPVDMYCALKVMHAPKIKVVTLVGVDHGPPRYIRDVGLLPTFLQRFINNQDMPPVPGAGSVLQLDGFSDLYLGAFQAIKRGNWEDAERIGLEALKKHPTSDFCRYLVSLAQAKLGRQFDALVNISIATALAHDRTEEYVRLQLHLAYCVREVGDFYRAAEIYRALTVRDEDNHKAFYGLGMCLLKLDNTADANAAFMRAYEISPSHPSYAKRAAAISRAAEPSPIRKLMGYFK